VKRKADGEHGEVVGRSSTSAVTRSVAAVCNVVLLGFVYWAFVDQYPHPEEDGLVAFVVVMMVTPILSLVVLLRGGSLVRAEPAAS
jgi:hypothetical protein